MCDTHLRFSVILKTLTLAGQEFLEVYEKMDHNCQSLLHALRFVFWISAALHASDAQFSEQQMLRNNFVHKGA